MNIFALDNDPSKAAEYHCDKHVLKMLLESAQLLSTMVHALAPGQVIPGTDDNGEPILTWYGNKVYKPTHMNHPCSVWVRHSMRNAMWLADLGHALNHQSEIRWHKPAYKAHAVLNGIASCISKLPFENSKVEPFTLALPKEIRELNLDNVTSYRLYYASAKRSFATWTRLGKQPYWWNDMCHHANNLGLSTINLANDGV